MKEYEQQATQIRSQISVLVSETQANITAINATAAAKAFNINQNATATALNNTINAETDAYLDVKTVNSNFTFKFLENRSYRRRFE